MIGPKTDANIVRKMMGSLRHRGPDDEGLWESTGVCLGHQRLSVIDLNTGRQPIPAGFALIRLPAEAIRARRDSRYAREAGTG